jgi:glycosyltransferase involved in cell wall biosynthesis
LGRQYSREKGKIRMKVLYVSYDGMTDVLGRSQVIPYLQGLSRRGHQIHLVSFEKKNASADGHEEVMQLLNADGIKWHPQRFHSKPPGVSKLIDLFRVKFITRKLHKKEQFEIIHCRSYIAAIAGLALKKNYGVKFVFDMRGFWVDERVEGDIWNLRNPVYRLFYKYFKNKEKQFFFHADAVVSLTHNGKGIIDDQFGSDASQKTTVIPCCVDAELFSRERIPDERISALRDQIGLDKDTFVMSYLGSTGTWYLTDEMLQFFTVVQQKYRNSVFLFISGDDPEFIKKKALQHHIEERRILVKKARREDVPLYLLLCSLSVYFIKPVFSKRASSPTKQAEIMSMGIPVVCNAGIGDSAMIMNEDKAGMMINGFSDDEYTRAVEGIENLLNLDPQKLREIALKFFNLEDGIDKYHQIYKNLADQTLNIKA